MSDKPTILFLALIPTDYSPYLAASYGMQRSFDLLPHKLSVLALVAWLREHVCDGKYVWAGSMDEGSRIFEEAIRTVKPDAIGFSLVTEEFMKHRGVMQWLKAKYPELPIIVGGPHVTAMPEHTLKHFPEIDYVVVGEGEATLEELLKAIKEKTPVDGISGIAYRGKNGEAVVNGERACIEDINQLPDPAYDLIFDPNSPPDQRSTFPLVCSYGCYFHCTFCSVPHGYYRNLTPEKVADRMERLQKEYGVEYFAIRDSFWPPKRDWMEKFCDEVERRNLKIKFHFQTRAGVLTEDNLKRLRKIGAQAIAIGVEAGDPEILKSIKKGITIDLARKTFVALNNAGIFSIAFFIFGNKGETKETIQKSIDLSHELNGSIAFYHVLYPLPGAEAYESVRSDQKDWWMGGELPSICELSVPELENLATEAFLRYPLRMSWVSQHVIGGRLSGEFRAIARRIFLVHLRKYLLGMTERFAPARKLIRMMKKK